MLLYYIYKYSIPYALIFIKNEATFKEKKKGKNQDIILPIPFKNLTRSSCREDSIFLVNNRISNFELNL